jgi:HTH-type transcriptional regulator/antitoxin HigA
MNIRPIKTEKDYREALKRMKEIFDAQIGSLESNEADILGMMIDEYEIKHYHMETPDPIEAIKIRTEVMQLKQVDLVNAKGGESRVSEVLNRKRKLTVGMIRNWTRRLNLSSEILISEYNLVR